MRNSNKNRDERIGKIIQDYYYKYKIYMNKLNNLRVYRICLVLDLLNK